MPAAAACGERRTRAAPARRLRGPASSGRRRSSTPRAAVDQRPAQAAGPRGGRAVDGRPGRRADRGTRAAGPRAGSRRRATSTCPCCCGPRRPARAGACCPWRRGWRWRRRWPETASRPALKWPNDVMVGGRKLGGILVEAHLERGRPRVRRGRHRRQRGRCAAPDLPADVAATRRPRRPRSSRARWTASRSRPRSWPAWPSGIMPSLAKVRAAVQAAWRARAVPWWGRRGRGPRPGERRLRGIARDLDERGALILELEDGTRAVLALWRSARGAAGPRLRPTCPCSSPSTSATRTPSSASTRARSSRRTGASPRGASRPPTSTASWCATSSPPPASTRPDRRRGPRQRGAAAHLGAGDAVARSTSATIRSSSSPACKTGMPILYEPPSDVGADRIVNGVAAFAAYGGPVIVVDFGTATTFDVVTRKGEYIGGVICPGIGISADALFQRAARLPRVDVRNPGKVIGRSTVGSIQSGLYFGYAAMVEGIIAAHPRRAGRARARGGHRRPGRDAGRRHPVDRGRRSRAHPDRPAPHLGAQPRVRTLSRAVAARRLRGPSRRKRPTTRRSRSSSSRGAGDPLFLSNADWLLIRKWRLAGPARCASSCAASPTPSTGTRTPGAASARWAASPTARPRWTPRASAGSGRCRSTRRRRRACPPRVAAFADALLAATGLGPRGAAARAIGRRPSCARGPAARPRVRAASRS